MEDLSWESFSKIIINKTSRTIGDLDAKSSSLGGIPGVVSPVPEIISFRLSEEMDFIVLGCILFV